MPYQVVRSFLAVVQCPNEFFDRFQLGKPKSQGTAKLAAEIRPRSENVFGTAHERYGA